MDRAGNIPDRLQFHARSGAFRFGLEHERTLARLDRNTDSEFFLDVINDLDNLQRPNTQVLKPGIVRQLLDRNLRPLRDNALDFVECFQGQGSRAQNASPWPVVIGLFDPASHSVQIERARSNAENPNEVAIKMKTTMSQYR